MCIIVLRAASLIVKMKLPQIFKHSLQLKACLPSPLKRREIPLTFFTVQAFCSFRKKAYFCLGVAVTRYALSYPRGRSLWTFDSLFFVMYHLQVTKPNNRCHCYYPN